ncbi:MAG: dTDP-4-dehydrorhamnose reductase [Acidimicrobiia bacterium]|nr:dTDP-4-dehydrorhamnose reductase [Acidimicrobiia bacterium]
MTRVLITGATGQVGRELVEVFADLEVTALDRAHLDVTHRDDVLDVVRRLRPHVVVNAAAWTDVDGCESDPERAHRVNAESVRWLTEATREVGGHLCHISTDYVFDGTARRPYREDDATNPRSVYGRSKLAGELELDPSATLVRTSWVFGRYGSNVVGTVLRLLDAGAPLRFVDDQVGCPTEAYDLALTIRGLVDARHAGPVHVTNDEPMSWFGFVQRVAAAAGGDPEQVEPIQTADLVPPRPAPRPPYSVLDGSLLHSLDTTAPGDLDRAIERVVAAMRSTVKR